MEQKEGSLLPPALNPLSIARMIWKRRWLILAIWVGVSVATMLFVRRLPKLYRAEAVILVDAQKIPEKFVASTVSGDAAERLASITQQLLSGTRLKAVIDEFRLYPGETRRSPEDVVEAMRKDIGIQPERTGNVRRMNAFRVSYEGKDPNVVAQVANRLAGSFIEENLKTREVQAEGTASFIETQLQTAKQRLDELEASLSQYKVRYAGELPQQENALAGTLGRLHAELQTNTDGINRAQESRTLAQDALSRAEATLARLREATRETPAAAAAVQTDAPRAAPLRQAPRVVLPSERAAEQLEQARLRYSDSHPEVRRLRVVLENMRANEAREAAERPVTAAASDPAPAAPAPARPKAPAANPQNALLNAEIAQAQDRISSATKQIAVLDKEIQDRQKRNEQIKAAMASYQARLDKLPIREQEMAALTRDYQISKANYQSLLDKKLSAEMATDMERRQKAERFTILDPARVPDKPSKPNVKVFAAIGIGGGLVLGIAIGFLIELAFGYLLGEWELPPSLHVLAQVPEISVPAGGGRQITTGGVAAALGVTMVGLATVLARLISRNS